VCDTNAVIWYFHKAFNVPDRLTAGARRLMDASIFGYSDVRLSIPGIVFVEIFDKWCLSEEDVARIHAEVFTRLNDAPNVEIRPLDSELLFACAQLGGELTDHDVHDKLVVAAAEVLECDLITSDGIIQSYVRSATMIPQAFS